MRNWPTADYKLLLTGNLPQPACAATRPWRIDAKMSKFSARPERQLSFTPALLSEEIGVEISEKL